MPNLTLPEHLQLARANTPLQKMEHLSKQFDVEIFFKRDDLTGSELSGNKIRKLEYLLADAKAQGADTIITCGGAQSNHCRITAVAARRCGLSTTILLRTADPKNPPPTEGNILLDKLVGAEIVWVSPEEYKNRSAVFEQEAKRLVQNGHRPYIIPEGGSNHIGSWGYIAAMEEIQHDLIAIGKDNFSKTTVLSAAGSGGTTAGLILGKKMLGLDVNVAAVNVCDDETYFKNEIAAICSDFINNFAHDIHVAKDEIHIVDGYVGRGYALSSPEELRAIYNLSLTEAVVLDPVYTGKAYYGMINELKKNNNAFGERIVFVHTGGIFGLFPMAAMFEEIFNG